ncbi:hypothetical protein [Amycolatopsis rubida]|uniref:Uncharacterized protein n=1 Tax=Amycolatopsis rubida TaxID=112413 RepID=A0A1I5MFL6_9PSEU|nr:hypothetical protein [Amycolatopsis rubida]SFP08384.1 hypothetical protein SAMN05421854_10431 [Amycolatopsis rubida]
MGWLITDHNEVYEDGEGKLIERNGCEIPMTMDQLKAMRAWRTEQERTLEPAPEIARPVLEHIA